MAACSNARLTALAAEAARLVKASCPFKQSLPSASQAMRTSWRQNGLPIRLCGCPLQHLSLTRLAGQLVKQVVPNQEDFQELIPPPLFRTVRSRTLVQVNDWTRVLEPFSSPASIPISLQCVCTPALKLRSRPWPSVPAPTRWATTLFLARINTRRTPRTAGV